MDDKQTDNLNKDFDETKRKSLIKMGKRAAYMSPVVLTLLTSQKATAVSGYGQCIGAGTSGTCSS